MRGSLIRTVTRVERRLARLAKAIERRPQEKQAPSDWRRIEDEVWALVQEACSLSQAAKSKGDIRASQACVGIALRGLALLGRLKRERELEEIRALVERMEGGSG
ncbi:MAG: hypothetical protein NZ733_03740 [Aigarchaeota archaeon]|nr:hypothetical protein [Aigarchaeota archaeon]MCS7127352.1 hypothetical protein [Candidatus Calditenuaceae archaeon]MDW8042858.1 hypothetical protein [Nitrososphaerota archaeon]